MSEFFYHCSVRGAQAFTWLALLVLGMVAGYAAQVGFVLLGVLLAPTGVLVAAVGWANMSPCDCDRCHRK